MSGPALILPVSLLVVLVFLLVNLRVIIWDLIDGIADSPHPAKTFIRVICLLFATLGACLLGAVIVLLGLFILQHLA